MLNDQLEQASLRAAQNIKRMIIIAVVFVVFIIGVFYGFLKFDNTADDVASGYGDGSGGYRPPAPFNQTGPDQTSPAQSPTKPVDNNPSPSLSDVLPLDGKKQVDEKSLNQFKADITAFEENIISQIENEDFKNWDDATYQSVVDRKDKALQLFSQGEYSEASDVLSAATDDALAALTDMENTFKGQMNVATTAYENDDLETAKLAIDKALAVKPKNIPAGVLKRQIDKLPETLKLIENAVVARAENNLVKERAALKKVIENAPERESLQTRLRAVNAEILENDYSRYTNAAFAAIDQRQLKAANKNYIKARSIFQNRTEISLLKQKVKTLKKELDAEQNIRDAENAIKQQNWQAAAGYFNKASAIFPQNKTVVDGLLLANKINSINDQLQSMLDKPDRLTSKSLRRTAKTLLKQSDGVSRLSKSMILRAGNLTRLVEAYSTDIDIFIQSDGLTFVSVRSIGQVGLTKGRTIKLKPGRYTFEGKRDGFQSKRIDVDIPPGSQSITVTVIADDPI